MVGTASDGGTICNVSYGGVGCYDGWGNYSWEIGVRPVVEISKDKVAFVSENAYAGCATCNSTGFESVYMCANCGIQSNTINCVNTYAAECIEQMIGCGALVELPDDSETYHEGCGGHLWGAPAYKIDYPSCDCETFLTFQRPEPISTNCPDCEIVYENPESGK